MSARAWYRIALAGTGPEPVVVIATGGHLGEAIAAGVREVGRGAWAAAVAPADASEVPLGESVRPQAAVARGAADRLEVGLRWPLGVVPSWKDAARAATVVEGFTRRPAAGGVHVLEAQVAGPRLDDVLLSIVERLPAADNVEVKVMDHFDAAPATDVWLSGRSDVRRAIRLLDDHDVELLHNGHVEVSIYLRKQRSTLRLGEHKTLVWLSEDAALTEQVVGWLRAAELDERPELTTLGQLAHFHWRPAATSPRPRLTERLRRLGMRKVDSWKARG